MSENDINDLVQRISPMIRELQSEAKRLGLFLADRELLSCGACGLAEDIVADGRLITYQGEPPGEDTGLRFDDLGDHVRFRCPLCGAVLEVGMVRFADERCNNGPLWGP
jgi:ribosomal protein S27AE